MTGCFHYQPNLALRVRCLLPRGVRWSHGFHARPRKSVLIADFRMIATTALSTSLFTSSNAAIEMMDEVKTATTTEVTRSRRDVLSMCFMPLRIGRMGSSGYGNNSGPWGRLFPDDIHRFRMRSLMVVFERPAKSGNSDRRWQTNSASCVAVCPRSFANLTSS